MPTRTLAPSKLALSILALVALLLLTATYRLEIAAPNPVSQDSQQVDGNVAGNRHGQDELDAPVARPLQGPASEAAYANSSGQVPSNDQYTLLGQSRVEMERRLSQSSERCSMTDLELLKGSLDVANAHRYCGQGQKAAVLYLDHAQHIALECGSLDPALRLRALVTHMDLLQALDLGGRAAATWRATAENLDDLILAALDSSPITSSAVADLLDQFLDKGREVAPPKGELEEPWYLTLRGMAGFLKKAPLLLRIQLTRGPGSEGFRKRARELEQRIAQVVGGSNARAKLVAAEKAWEKLASEFVAAFGPNPRVDLFLNWFTAKHGGDAWLVSVNRVESQRGQASTGRRPQREPYYLATLLSPRGSIHEIDLGPADLIDRLLEGWHTACFSGGSKHGLRRRAYATGDALRSRMLDPIMDSMGSELDGAAIYLSLDEYLQRTPWSALPIPRQDPDRSRVRRIGEIQAIHRVEYLGHPDGRPQGIAQVAEALIVSDVDFGQASVPPIPGTKDEADVIDTLGGEAGLGVMHLSGADANKEHLNQAVGGMQYIHIATHSVVDPTACPDRRSRSVGGLLDDLVRVQIAPMTASGLYLSGSPSSVARGHRAPSVLTCQELRLLDLRSCRLLVLSTCANEPLGHGSGWSASSLASAGLQAGAEAVLYSLWVVDDSVTTEFMEYFYGALWGQGMDVHDALLSAQTLMARQGHTPRTWAGWVVLNRE